jgi:hypothetical protein
MRLEATKSLFFALDLVLKSCASRQSYECRGGTELSKVAPVAAAGIVGVVHPMVAVDVPGLAEVASCILFQRVTIHASVYGVQRNLS